MCLSSHHVLDAGLRSGGFPHTVQRRLLTQVHGRQVLTQLRTAHTIWNLQPEKSVNSPKSSSPHNITRLVARDLCDPGHLFTNNTCQYIHVHPVCAFNFGNANLFNLTKNKPHRWKSQCPFKYWLSIKKLPEKKIFYWAGGPSLRALIHGRGGLAIGQRQAGVVRVHTTIWVRVGLAYKQKHQLLTHCTY